MASNRGYKMNFFFHITSIFNNYVNYTVCNGPNPINIYKKIYITKHLNPKNNTD